MAKIENSKSAAEAARIQWRQKVMAFPEGLLWLVVQAQDRKTREWDLGPHRYIPGVSEKLCALKTR